MKPAYFSGIYCGLVALLKSPGEAGAILDVTGTCLTGFWVDSDRDSIVDNNEVGVRPTRQCDSRVVPGRETGLWKSISNGEQCSIMSCGDIIYDDMISGSVYMTMDRNQYYVKDIVEKYSEYVQPENIRGFIGHTIRNNDANNCSRDNLDEEAYGNCVKDLLNYTGFGEIEQNAIVNRKICRIGYSSNDLAVTCKINPNTNAAKWYKTEGESCKINRCSNLEEYNAENGFAKWTSIISSHDADGNGSISESERIIANGTCAPGYGGAPTRECLPDGTWGKVENPCVGSCMATDPKFLNSGVAIGNEVWEVDSKGGKYITANTDVSGAVCKFGYGTALDGNQNRSNLPPVVRCDERGEWDIQNPCSQLRNCTIPSGSLFDANTPNATRDTYNEYYINVDTPDCGNGLFYYVTSNNFTLGNGQSFGFTISDFCDEGTAECDMKQFFWECNDGNWIKHENGTHAYNTHGGCYSDLFKTYVFVNNPHYFGATPLFGNIVVEVYNGYNRNYHWTTKVLP